MILYCVHSLATILGFSAYDEAALLEPLGVAHNAMEQLKVSGEAVLIIGAGTIGILACTVAKIMGATRLVSSQGEIRAPSQYKDRLIYVWRYPC